MHCPLYRNARSPRAFILGPRDTPVLRTPTCLPTVPIVLAAHTFTKVVPLAVQAVVIFVVNMNLWVSHTHDEAVQQLRCASAYTCFHLAYAIHGAFGFGRAPLMSRHSVVIGIVHESDEALSQRDVFHKVACADRLDMSGRFSVQEGQTGRNVLTVSTIFSK